MGAYIQLGSSQTEVWLLSIAWFKIAGIYSAGLKSDRSMIVKYCWFKIAGIYSAGLKSDRSMIVKYCLI